jgi:hypothetical protein
MLIQVKHVKPAYQEESPPQIIVDGKNYPFYLDEIEFKPRLQTRLDVLQGACRSLVLEQTEVVRRGIPEIQQVKDLFATGCPKGARTRQHLDPRRLR